MQRGFFRERLMTEDTIAAIATPRGEGGISIIRVSGKDAFSSVNMIFKGRRRPGHNPKDRVFHGHILDGEEPIDDVLVTTFHSPASYTGEDVVEISCHGSPFITQRILELLTFNNVRPARPGEFTERAYLNGRMDLVQAEAVADLIQAKTEASRRVAIYQLEGNLSDQVQTMRKSLIETVSLLELELDFGEEDLTFTSKQEVAKMLDGMVKTMQSLIASFDRGRICRDGIRMAIVGRPNVGKSSILNVLLEKERAIVTEVAGTTRDTIEDILDIEGVLFRIIDTAGIRQSTDPIEQEGVRRALSAMEQAELVLLVLDGSDALMPEDEELIRQIKGFDKTTLVVINKTDLKTMLDPSLIRKRTGTGTVLNISCKTGKGVPDLVRCLQDVVLQGGFPHEGDVLLTRVRHRDAFQKTVVAISQAIESLKTNMSQEFVALDLRSALNTLGEIVGETTADDILNHIFSEFCIGK